MRILGTVALSMVVSVSLDAQGLESRDKAILATAIDSIAAANLAGGRAAGMSIAVVKGRDTITLKGYGFADLEFDVATPDRAIYEIGSVTKQFTAAAILLLQERGKLSLEDQITGLPADIRDFGNPDAIRNWQAAGGSVRLVKLTGTQPNPDESFDISGDAQLTGGGYVVGKIDYTTKGVLDRFAQLLPPVQLAMLKGAPQADGSFRNTVTVVDGQVKILTFVFAQLPPLF